MLSYRRRKNISAGPMSSKNNNKPSNSNDGAITTTNNKPDGNNGTTTGSGKWTDNFTWQNSAKAGGVLGIAGLITGLAFLPDALVKPMQQALFGWLPEEMQPYACSGSCISSCSLVSGALVIAIIFLLK